MEIYTGKKEGTFPGQIVAQNGVGYPNIHQIVYNGDALVYTNLACGNSFASEFAFDGSQNQPNSTNLTSVNYDTRTNSYASLPYKGDSVICTTGFGSNCTDTYTSLPTIQKETAAGQAPKVTSCAYNMPFTSGQNAQSSFDQASGFTVEYAGS